MRNMIGGKFKGFNYVFQRNNGRHSAGCSSKNNHNLDKILPQRDCQITGIVPLIQASFTASPLCLPWD